MRHWLGSSASEGATERAWRTGLDPVDPAANFGEHLPPSRASVSTRFKLGRWSNQRPFETRDPVNIPVCRPALVLALALSVSFPTLARGHFSDQEPLTVPHPTSFSECRQFFADGRPPVVPKRAALRELCYAAFAVLHSGETKTPVYVAQRLNRKSLEDAHERRADKFFADARLSAPISYRELVRRTGVEFLPIVGR